MKIRLIILFSILLCNATVNAQIHKIKGIVVDEHLTPVSGVSVSLLQASDTIVQSKTKTDNRGTFSFPNNTSDRVNIRLSHVAYESEVVSLNQRCDTTILISLILKNYQLNAVTVSDRRKPIEYRDGNVIVNVGSLTGIQSEKASDVLQKLPGIIINNQGTIMLHGQRVSINLDGQELKAVDPMILLKSLPAESLSEIELVSNKTSQYDASAGAIINIVSKHRITNGYNINTSISGTIDRYGKADSSPDFYWMFRKNKLLFSNTLSYDAYTNSDKADTYSDFRNTGQQMLEHTYEIFRSGRIIDNANLAWDLNKSRRLNFNLFVFNGWENRKMTNEQIIGNDTTNYFLIPHPYHFVLSAYTGYSGGIGTFSYGIIYNKTTYDYKYRTLYDGGDIQYMNLHRNIRTLQHIGKWDLLKKYQANKLTVKGGAKYELSHISNNDHYTPALYPNTLFSGTEGILSVYGSLKYKISNGFSVYTGYRTEFTDYTFNIKSNNEKNTRNYWNSLPSAIADWTVSKDYSVSLALTGTIDRPGYEILTPGITYWNDKEYSRGNPALNPTKTYLLKLSNRLWNNLEITIAGQYIKDFSQEIMIEHERGITESFYINAVDSRGFSVYADYPFTLLDKRMTGQISGGYNRGVYANPQNGFQLLAEDRKYYSACLSGNVDYNLTSCWELNGSVFCQARAHDLQVETKSDYYCNLGTQYAMLRNKNMVISFNVKDLLNSDKTHRVNYYNDVVRVADVKPNSQVFVLTVSYRFGKGHKIDESPASDPNNTQRCF